MAFAVRVLRRHFRATFALTGPSSSNAKLVVQSSVALARGVAFELTFRSCMSQEGQEKPFSLEQVNRHTVG